MESTRAVEWNPTVWVESSRQYLSDVRTESRKVTSPSQREYVGGTVGVVVIVAILTLVLGLIDMGLSQIMELILR